MLGMHSLCITFRGFLMFTSSTTSSFYTMSQVLSELVFAQKLLFANRTSVSANAHVNSVDVSVQTLFEGECPVAYRTWPNVAYTRQIKLKEQRK